MRSSAGLQCVGINRGALGSFLGSVHGRRRLRRVRQTACPRSRCRRACRSPSTMRSRRMAGSRTVRSSVSSGCRRCMPRGSRPSSQPRLPAKSFVVHNINFPYPCAGDAQVRRTVPARIMSKGLFSPRADDGAHKFAFKHTARRTCHPSPSLRTLAALDSGFISHRRCSDYSKLGLRSESGTVIAFVGMIEVQNLTRVFRTYKKLPGFWGGVKGLSSTGSMRTRRHRQKDAALLDRRGGEFVGFLGPRTGRERQRP